MIKDAATRLSIQKEWQFVRDTQGMVGANTSWVFAGGGYMSRSLPELAYTLCVLFAFSVLEHTLIALEAEGHFKSSQQTLNGRMTASRNVLPWSDFAIMTTHRNARNSVAHSQLRLSKDDCEAILNAIESELRAWQVL